MITPSITFDDSQVTSLWAGLSIEDVKEMLRCDVEEIDRLHQLQSEAAKIASTGHRKVEEIRLRQLILGWEHAQDAHWSWFKEIADVSTGTAERPQTMGPGLVGSGH
jgi:hypothetical protein